jgi:hypothetical protein
VTPCRYGADAASLTNSVCRVRGLAFVSQKSAFCGQGKKTILPWYLPFYIVTVWRFNEAESSCLLSDKERRTPPPAIELLMPIHRVPAAVLLT